MEPQREARIAACLEVAPSLARRRRSHARERRRRPRRGRPRPRARPRAGSRGRNRRRRTRAARCARRARSARRRPRGRRGAGRAPCRDRGRSRTCPRTSSCRGRASSPVTARDRDELVLARGAGCPDRREDAAAGGVQLLVAGAAGAERELVHAVAAEAQRACGSRRGPGWPQSPRPSSSSTRRRRGSSAMRPMASIAAVARRGRTRPRDGDLPQRGPRNGALRPRASRPVRDRGSGGRRGQQAPRARKVESALPSCVQRLLVAGVGMAHDPGAGIGRRARVRAVRLQRRSRPRARPCRRGSSCRCRRRHRDARRPTSLPRRC